MDFHFHVFLEWIYVHKAAEEMHEGETDTVTEAEHTLHDRMTPRWKWIMHDHFWPDIDEAFNALYPEFQQSWIQCHTPHFFSTNDFLGLSTGKTTLRATQPAAIKRQSNFLSMDYFDCRCCSLTYYLIVAEGTSTSHTYGLTCKIQVCAEFQQSWRINLGVQRVGIC